MKFGLRIIVSGLAALVAGAVFISMSFDEPAEGMEATPMWKGVLAIVLGIALLGYGLKYIIHDSKDQRDPQEKTDEAT